MKIINLQLFGNEIHSINNTDTGFNKLSHEDKTYYDKVLLRNAKPNLVHAQFGQKRPIPKHGGRTIEFRKFSSLPKATTPITEGVTPSRSTTAVSNITATVSQYGSYIEYTDLLDLTAIDPVVQEFVELIGDQAGLTMDTVVRDILNAGTNVQYCDKVSSGTHTTVTSRGSLDTTANLTVDEIERAATCLAAKNIKKINGSYVAIIHPHMVYELRRDSRFIDIHKYEDSVTLFEREVGKVAGVRFVESSEAKVYGGANLAGTTRNLAINKNGGYTGAITSVDFDGGTVKADELIGRYIMINGISAKVTDNTTTSITFGSTDFGTITDNEIIYPGESGNDAGLSVYSTLILGENAYGITDVEGGGVQTVIKGLGEGGSDPLNQKGTIGWKALETAVRLDESAILRVESVASRSDYQYTPAN